MPILPDNESEYIEEDEDVISADTIDGAEITDNEASYSNPFDYNGPSDIGVPESSEVTPVEPEPDETYYEVTYRGRFQLDDYDPPYLEELYQNGAKFYAIYDDDTEVEVQWYEIEDLDPMETEIDLANSIASASNQHFWDDDNGAHVAEVSKEDWETAVEANFSDLSASKNYYNILMNSLGILLRRATFNLATITRAGISFYDGLGNNVDNIMASFGRSGAQIGKSSQKHVIINTDGIGSYNGDGTVADFTMRGASIVDGTVRGSSLVDNTITGGKIADTTITGSKLVDSTITGAKIANATITGSNIDYGTITNANIQDGTITGAKIQGSTLTNIPFASIVNAAIEVATIAQTEIGKATIRQAQVENLSADYAHLTQGVIDNAKIDKADVNGLAATYATIANLTAANAKISNLEATRVTTDDLEANYIDANTIEATYTKTDFSNTDVAWIQNGVIKDGSISSAMINDVSANKLTAGTINGSVINVTNLNADNITTGTINGQRIGEGSLSLSKLEDDVYTEAEVDAKLSTMQSQIDGAIETWTGTAVPTLQNSPASSWNTTALKDSHVGDVYFVVNSQSQQNGYNYRFTKSGSTYSWQLIKDSDVTNALQRLTTAEGKITTFDTDISQLKTDTGTLTTKTTSLETRMSDAEADILDKVDTTTFNEVSDTVDQHSQTISQHTTAISNKADSSTVTAVTNRVSKNEQDISGINTTIGELQTTVESKADGSTVSTISNKLNTVSDTVDGHTQSISSITSTQTTMQGKLDKTLVETTQLWFSKANTTAPNKPTAQVTSTSTDGNAWRVVVPAYNASYPNYYYCYQWKYSDGTYGWSSVTRDIAMGESQERARTAITNAATADTKAGNAASAAATAVSTANTANSNASTALSTANTAASDASDAKADAATAVSTANTASSNASAALSTANTASSNASTAVSTANTAKSTADTAKATADKNVKSTTQLWYTKANETAPAKPTTKVTSTAVSGNAWRVVVPTYASDYPYYFYCYQYELADGTFTWSDVVYDQATTEAQNVARTASADLTEFHQEYATFKQTVNEFESTVGETYATKMDVDGKISQEVSNRNSAIQQSADAIALTVSKSYLQTQSRGEQLITNGSGLMGDNTNFSSWRFDGSVSNNSPGSFTRDVGSTTIMTDELFAVDPSKEYVAEFDVYASGSGALPKMYAMLSMYDADKKFIQIQYCSYIIGSTTTLAREVKNGDTKIYLTSAAGFTDTSSVPTHQRALIFWNYTNSFGYTYPPETYSRNIAHNAAGLWDVGAVDKTNNVITLKSAWTYGTYPAGTSVSQNSSGNTYVYFWYVTSNFPVDVWTHAKGTYHGLQTGIAQAPGKFYPGAAYCKVGWLWNYQNDTSNPQKQLWITNVSVKERVATSDDLNQLKAQYGTCSTAAGTSAKVVSLADFALYIGATISVRFNSGNTVASPTLNVNNTGAKAVVVNGSATPTADQCKWNAYATCQFTYDGAYWRYVGSDQEAVRIVNAETAIEQNSEQITLRATKTEMKQAIDAIEVGGRNRLINTENPTSQKPVKGSSCADPGILAGTVTYADGVGTYTVTDTGTRERYIRFVPSNTSDNLSLMELPSPGEFVFSGYVKTNLKNSTYLNVRMQGGASGWTNPTIENLVTGSVTTDSYLPIVSGISDWTYFAAKVTFTVEVHHFFLSFQLRMTDGTVSIPIGDALAVGDTFEFKKLKFERGNRATDWSPAPEDIESRIEAAEASIAINADNIESKVSKDGVISSINQSAESVQIHANRVNIEGATIFSSGRLSTTSLNNAYDAKGAAASLIAGGDNLIGRFNFAASSGATYNHLTGTLTSTTTTNTADSAANLHAYSNTAVVKRLGSSFGIEHVGKVCNWTFKKESTFNRICLKFNGNKVDARIFWDISSIANGTELTLSFKLDSISSDGHGNGGVMSGINLRNGNMPSQWSLAPEDVEIGGRNLLRNSKAEHSQSSSTSAWFEWPITEAPLDTSQDYTFSFDAKTSNGTDVFYVDFANGSSATQENMAMGVKPTTTYTRMSVTARTTKTNIRSMIVSSTTGYGRGNASNTGGTLYIKNVKLEKGTKATDWTPAPEDTDAAISVVSTVANNAAPKTSAVSEEQYIYFQAESGEDVLSTVPSSVWVTKTDECVTVADDEGTSVNTRAWSTKTPTYNSTYPVTWMAKQRKTVSGTVTTTTPTRHAVTTVIDGAQITTGTIDAERLNVDDIASNSVMVTAINSAVSEGTENLISSEDAGTMIQNSIEASESRTNAAISNLNDDVSDLSNNVSSLMDWTEIGPASLKMGKATSYVTMELTNESLEFWASDEALMRLGVTKDDNENVTGSYMVIDKAVILQQLQFGNYAFRDRGSDHMSLQWIGD